MSLASNKDAALRFVRARGYVGGELPKGRPDREWACPLAEALDVPVNCSRAGLIYVDDRIVTLDRSVCRFMRDFDKGKYPELVV